MLWKSPLKTELINQYLQVILNNNCFEFSEKVFQQISGKVIGTNFATSYACIYMDEVETEFLQIQRFKLVVWPRFIDYLFFI